jgi:riboflavin synthase
MFTGIVKEVGTIKDIKPNNDGFELEVFCESLLPDIEIDDSVAINGVCQTATFVGGGYFKVQAVKETLDKTNFKELQKGSVVNLELALRPMDRMGGHIVQGHVNDLVTLEKLDKRENNYLATFSVSKDWIKYIVGEGSVTLNGISLTVSHLEREALKFSVSVIPHTWNQTSFNKLSLGSKVNLEVDIIGKYVESLLFYAQGNKTSSNVTLEMLKAKGW